MLQEFNPRNQEISIWVNGKLEKRADAKVSVFDSVVQGGDAVWEGIRVYRQGVYCLDDHLKRLIDSAQALAFENVPPLTTIKSAIKATLRANGMTHDTHMRLTLTRGIKTTSGMDPRLNTSGCTLIVLAEWKAPVFNNEKGIKCITSSIRRNSPSFLDSRIHHNNLLNNILAKIQANVAGKDAAVMLDEAGYVAELNDTNVFIIEGTKLITPHPDACLPGITRGKVLSLAQSCGLEPTERRVSLTNCYTADGMFATGTMGELTPVVEVDGRSITNANHNEQFQSLNKAFIESRAKWCTPIDEL